METQHEPEKPVKSKILSDASDHISLDEVRSSPLKRNKQNKAFTVSSSSSSCPSSHKSLKPSLCEAPRSAAPEPPGPGSRTFSGAAHMETHLTLHRWRSSAARPEQCGADAWSRSTLRARSLGSRLWSPQRQTLGRKLAEGLRGGYHIPQQRLQPRMRRTSPCM